MSPKGGHVKAVVVGHLQPTFWRLYPLNWYILVGQKILI